jgi:hypothetical protein
MFIQGNLAYTIQYRAFEQEIKQKNSKLNFDVTDVPQFDLGNVRTYGRFNMDCLNRNLANKSDDKVKAGLENDADVIKHYKAQEFLKYMTTKEVQSQIAGKTAMPSAHLEVIKEQQNGDQTVRIFANGALNAENYYKKDVIRNEKMWSDMLERIQISSMPFSDSLNQARTDYEATIENDARLRN